MEYKYITENNLENKQNYMYSEFGEAAFLHAYKSSRTSFVKEMADYYGGDFHETREELFKLKSRLSNADDLDVVSWRDTIDAYVKRFEVSKRLFTEYDEKWKPTEHATYEQIDIYLLLAECCLQVYKITKCTKYFSCLLKIDDTLLSIKDMITNSEKERLSHILEGEIEEYDKLAESLEVEI